ncbi:hypothetical protein N0V90_011603 [Kalmusia sp. IMI 367209]|nr:hypothetical protein N0V90_011603 [Kalmusia sp. IMI 367209]
MEPIAIIGFAFRLPGGANDESSLWTLLQENRNVMTEYPQSRVNIDAFYDPGKKRNNTLYSRGAHFIDGDPAVFDAPFFSVTTADAASMDPQHRKLMEVTYHALENAGIPIEEAAGSNTAVYASTMANDFERMLAKGSNIILSPEVSITESNMLFLSPDSQCATFTSRANGYGRGEGVIAIILKRLSDALADGDAIRAVIKGIGSNQDGRTQGLGRPSSDAQQALIERVYRDAAANPARTRYFEAHGTGTAVGDPTETKAIGRFFRTSRSPDEPLYIGSIKSNIGHIEAGSGIAGVVKAILILERGVIPPNALFDKINPDIDCDFYNLEVPTASTAWPSHDLRRISINSFGFGGSNSHVILDDAKHFLEDIGAVGYHNTTMHPQGTSDGYQVSDKIDSVSTSEGELQIMTFTAKDAAALKRMVHAYGHYYDSTIRSQPDKLKQLAYTLARRRSKFPWRSFAILSPKSGTKLNVDEICNSSVRVESGKTGIGFVFTGQGAQYAGMGLALLEYTIFAETLHAINVIYQDLGAAWDVIDEMREGNNLEGPEYSQPLCTALQIALIELLKSWNIVPLSVVGHSSGEIAAAYMVGALDLPSACKVAFWRGRLASSLVKSTSTRGEMLNVNISESAATEHLLTCGLDESVTIACINSPSNVTVSGPSASIEEFHKRLTAAGIHVMPVNAGAAYHSPAMKAIAAEYLERLADIQEDFSSDRARRPIAMLSTVTGRTIRPHLASTPQYWVDNLISPVRFSNAVQFMTKLQRDTKFKLKIDNLRPIYDIIEIGPHASLRRPVMDSLSQDDRPSGYEVRYCSVLNRKLTGVRTPLEVPARLFTRGYPVDIAAANCSAGTKQMLPILTGTPLYPFDTSQRYWSESRLSRDFRLRGGGTSVSILGIRANDWNPLEPRWRKFVSVDEMPWVADHVVSETILFPAAGMLVMALAAAQENAELTVSGSRKSPEISGFFVKEASFLAPIVIRSRVELLTHLRPLRKNVEKVSRRSEVRIFTYTQNNDGKGIWTECFKAIIQTQHVSAAAEVDGGREARLSRDKVRDEIERARQICKKPVSKRDFYKFHTSRGLRYGRSFQLVDDIRWDEGRTSMSAVQCSSSDCPIGALVHPTTLDAAFQTCMTAAWSKSMANNNSTMVPHRVLDTYVAAVGWQSAFHSPLNILTSSQLHPGGQNFTCRVLITNHDGDVLCDATKLEMSPVAGGVSEVVTEGRRIFYGVRWRPLTSLMSGQQVSTECRDGSIHSKEREREQEVASATFHHELDSMILSVMESTFTETSGIDTEMLPTHLQYYYAWMKRQLKVTRIKDISKSDLDVIWQRLLISKPSWRMFVTIARNLTAILQAKSDPLVLLFSTGEAEAFYSDICGQICPKLNPFFALTAHENPKQRILEVGAGTGSMTLSVLTALHEYEKMTGALAFSDYTYTDISPAFFDTARARFMDLVGNSRMLFKTCNLDTDILEQGFSAGEYDMVIASSVLHATLSVKSSLQNVRRALRPGGKLVLLEPTAPKEIFGSFAFGTLPGWWRGNEPKDAMSPALSEETWDALLKETGFSGNDVVLKDWEDPRCNYFSIIVSTADEGVAEEQSKSGTRRIIFVTTNSTNQYALAEQVLREANGRGQYTHSITSLDSFSKEIMSPNDIVVVLLEMEGPVVESVDDLGFKQLKDILLLSKHLLWVCTAVPADVSYPAKCLSNGLLRSLRTEDVEKRIIKLSIEDADPTCSNESTVSGIVRVFKASFEAQSQEIEYSLREGQFFTPRLEYRELLETDIRAALSPSLQRQPWSLKPAVKLQARTPGNIESLQFIEDLDFDIDIGPNDVEIEAKAWGLNFRDVLLALGRLEGDEFGFECAGLVTRVGTECIGMTPGDRVVMSSIGCMRQFPRCHQLEVRHIPTEMSFEAAASIIGPALTAVYSLIEVARLRPKEKILVHSATGATGQLAVMLAQALEAEVYCTVGSEAKKKLIIDRFGISPDHIFYSRDTSFAQGVKRVTKGYGVDVLLNSLSGDALIAGWECMAPYGRFIEIGKVDMIANEGLPMKGFQCNVTFAGIDFHHTSKFRKDITQRMLAKVMELIEQGKLMTPSPLQVYPVSQIEEAFRYLQSGQHMGRIVVMPKQGQVVPKYLTKRPTWKFNGDASYLIVGGFGGIGRAIMLWMESKGAKNIIVLSRSGPASAAAVGVVEELGKLGVQIYAPKCDVASLVDLKVALDMAMKMMPPIKGCINAAMALNDTMLANMSHAQWAETVNAKHKSSVHLSALLPPDLDFFLLLSSLAGVYGTPSQCNYSSGCASQDAIARERVTRGLKAVSLDIGWMRTIGVVAESQLYQRVREREADMQQIEEAEFMALLDVYCDPSRAVENEDDCQILLGPVIPADLRAIGEEPPPILQRPLFSGFDSPRSLNECSSIPDTNQKKPSAMYKIAATADEKVNVVVDALMSKMARALAIPPSDIDTGRPLFAYGVDSLVAVELRNWMVNEFSSEIAVFDIMDGITIAGIGALVVERSRE